MCIFENIFIQLPMIKFKTEWLERGILILQKELDSNPGPDIR